MLIKKTKNKNQNRITCSVKAYNTSPLAFIFCFITIIISSTTSIPKLCTGIGLIVIVPVDAVVSTGALIQAQVTARIDGSIL